MDEADAVTPGPTRPPGRLPTVKLQKYQHDLLVSFSALELIKREKLNKKKRRKRKKKERKKTGKNKLRGKLKEMRSLKIRNNLEVVN